MSTNVGQRNVPDTPQNRVLNAGEKALELSLYTVKICSNEKTFIPQYKQVTEEIVHTAVDLYARAYDANNIVVGKKDSVDYKKKAERRLELEYESIRLCSRLLGLINISQKLFHLRGKRVSFWTRLTLETRTYLNHWYESDKERYR